MENALRISFASSLTNLCEKNSSFDSGVLRICYTGENRNRSYFSKEDIEINIKTIYNCPLVVNYDVESGTFGGHDMRVVKDSDNNVKIINATEPVGVIPESSNVWFEWETDKNGVAHEYLYADVLPYGTRAFPPQQTCEEQDDGRTRRELDTGLHRVRMLPLHLSCQHTSARHHTSCQGRCNQSNTRTPGCRQEIIR